MILFVTRPLPVTWLVIKDARHKSAAEFYSAAIWSRSCRWAPNSEHSLVVEDFLRPRMEQELSLSRIFEPNNSSKYVVTEFI